MLTKTVTSLYDEMLRQYLADAGQRLAKPGFTRGAARALIAGLSKPSKMPGRGYGLPAKRCITGSRLHKVAGSVCESCYALKGRYVFGSVQEAQERRYAKLPASWRPVTVGDETQSLCPSVWVSAMVRAIPARAEYFRWHDSGDLQSPAHLIGIIAVALLRPDVRFWIPTREWPIVSRVIRGLFDYKIPPNLCIRISAHMVGRTAVSSLPTSTVGVDDSGFQCRAYERSGVCGSCRACWVPEVSNVNYPKH